MNTKFLCFFGVVEDINDPLKLGRVRVRCYNYHSPDREILPTDDLPWAQPIQNVCSAATGDIGISPTGLLNGSLVIGVFLDGESCQRPFIFGSIAGIPGLLGGETGNGGFGDPNGQYPYRKDEPDVNRLARNDNDYQHAILNFKNLFIDNLIDEPESAYKSIYPKNHVYESESGHITEIDDTPGSERLHKIHKTGTFEEIHPDGSRVTKIFGNDYLIVHENGKVRIRGNCKIYIDSDIELYTNGNLKTFVDGNQEQVVNGNMSINVRGDLDVRVDGNYKRTVKNNSHERYEGVKYEYIADDTYTVKKSGHTDYNCPTTRNGAQSCKEANGATNNSYVPYSIENLKDASMGGKEPIYVFPGGGGGLTDGSTDGLNLPKPQLEGGGFVSSGISEIPLKLSESGCQLGALSEKYESNGNPCAIGRLPTDGRAYGSYQIATATGTFSNYMNFLSVNYPDLYTELDNAGGATGAANETEAFKTAWQKQCTNLDSAQSQHDFIQATHYEPAASKIKSSTGIDFNERDCVLQDVLWSTSVQHGPSGANNVVNRAIQNTGKSAEELTDEELVNAIYDERSKTDIYFKRSSTKVRGQVRTRFSGERKIALSRLG